MKIIRITFSSIALIWCIGFFYFMYITDNISNDDLHKTDSIVVFGGKKQNLHTGVRLVKSGYAPIIFITGKKPKEEYSNFLKEQNIANEQFIFDEHIANNSHNYAVDTGRFIKKYQFESLRLVVSAYQLPRALKELEYNLPSNIIVIPHPVSRGKVDNFLMLKEYIKYTIVLVTSFIGTEHEINLSYS